MKPRLEVDERLRSPRRRIVAGPGAWGHTGRAMRRFGALLVLGASLAGCAGLGTRPVPPRVALTDLRLGDATLFAQHYVLTLEVQNPNSFELALEGMDCELLLNGEPFASGVSSQALTISPYGVGSLEVAVTSTLLDVVRQVAELERSGAERFRWQLRGQVGLRGAGRLPFDSGGEVSLDSRKILKAP